MRAATKDAWRRAKRSKTRISNSKSHSCRSRSTGFVILLRLKMIFQAHIPAHPLDQFIEAFIYFERVEHRHTVDRFLPNGDTEILIDFHDAPQYIYDNNSLKEIQACRHVWASGLRTEPITIP